MKRKVTKSVKKAQPGPKARLTRDQHLKLIEMHKSGEYKISTILKKFKISSPTLYIYLKRKVARG